MTRSLKKIPYFLFLLVLFFCLHGAVENYGYLNVFEVMEVAGIILLCMALFFVLILVISKNYLFSSLVTFFIALWYLFFGAVHDTVKAAGFLQFLQSFTVLLPVLLLVNIAVIWWLKRNTHLHQKLTIYLNILFLVFCLSDAVLLMGKHNNYRQPVVVPVPFDQSSVTQKPNVYFFLFDEYAGYKSLQDSFGFKNDSLYHFLKENDFIELPTFANYDFTPFCMSSILNMQYVPENYNRSLLVQPDIQQRFGEIRNAHVFSIFRSMNYSIENYSIFDIKDNPALFRSNGLFPIHAALLTNKVFHNRLLKGIGWWLLVGKFEIPALKKYYLYRKDNYNLQVEKLILKSMARKKERPVFSYAHFLLPHGQFYRDSSGAFNPIERVFDIKHLTDKTLYLAYLKYTNNIINDLVKNVNASDPGAIVIIMSDHGFYDYHNNGGYEPYNFDNICFLRLPGAKPDSSHLPRSNVNFFRYLFNTGYGQNLPYLKDSTVLIIEDPAVLR